MHPTQLEILDSLRQDGSRQFNELLRDVAETSDNLTYHLKQLQKAGFVISPAKGEYRLAERGLVYLNNNLELGHDLFPTVSCMLELYDRGNRLLVMKKRKQPFLGAVHLLTFGVTSGRSLNEQIQDFLNSYRVRAGELSFKCLHRERALRGELPMFDKFFIVFSGQFTGYEPRVDDRQFMTMSAAELESSPDVLSATKTVLGLTNESGFSETTNSNA